MTIDNLKGINNDLARTDNDGKEWKFPELINDLRKLTVTNPVEPEDNYSDKPKVPKLYIMKQAI